MQPRLDTTGLDQWSVFTLSCQAVVFVPELWNTVGLIFQSWTWINVDLLSFLSLYHWLKPKLSCSCLHLLFTYTMSLEILSSSLYAEIITRFFWPGLAWRGCLLNLLPSCHLELFLQLPPECFFPQHSAPYVESPVSWNPCMCLSWFISSFAVYIFVDHTPQVPLKTGVWK